MNKSIKEIGIASIGVLTTITLLSLLILACFPKLNWIEGIGYAGIIMYCVGWTCSILYTNNALYKIISKTK